MNIKVLTDSVADMTPEDIKRYDIGVIPLEVNFGSETYLDKLELTIEQFFQMQALSKVNPTTSQPSTGRFITAFQEALAKHELVIYIGVSNKLSGTFSGALLAAREVSSERLLLFDSGNVSFSQGMIVLAFCRKLDQFKSGEEALRYLAMLRNDLRSYYILDTLEYLMRGGRVNRLQGTIGELLGIKPIITIDDGNLKMIGKARGFRKAMQEVINHMSKEVVDGKVGGVGLYHAIAPERLDEFYRLLRDRFHLGPIYHAMVGSVIGTHSGPGAVAVAFFKDCNI